MKLFLLLAAVATFAAFQPASCLGYRNPLGGIQAVGTPYVLRDGSDYYLYVQTNYETGPNMGYRCWYSKNLVNWEPKGWVLLKTDTSWAQSNFWGGEVYKRDGYYYFFYSAAHTVGGPMQLCISRSTSPLGLFEEWKAPFFENENSNVSPSVFVDTDGKNYLYWSVIRPSDNPIYVQRIATDFTSLMGSSVMALGTPYSQWEYPTIYNNKNPIVERPYVMKRGGIYYMTYSGGHFAEPDYATGYAISSRPLATFKRYSGNPILKKNLSLTPPVVAPGMGSVVASPDNRDLFFIYDTPGDHATDPRSIFMDRMSFDKNGKLSIAGPTNTPQPDPSGAQGVILYDSDPFTTTNISMPGTTADGWSLLGMYSSPDLCTAYYDEASHSYRAQIKADPYRVREIGILNNRLAWLPYTLVGSNNYVRGKFYLYAGGQTNPSQLNTIPNLSIRLATRFSVITELAVNHHNNADWGNDFRAKELRPSTDPTKPSLYRIDFDPVDVPYLATTSGEGIQQAFEIVAMDPQDNGYIAMAESQLGVYPCSSLPDSNDPSILRKVYQPSATDAGDLKIFNSATDLQLYNQIRNTFDGDRPVDDPTTAPRPTYSEGPWGITMDTTQVPADRVGTIVRGLYPGAVQSQRVRVEPDTIYKIRFHVTGAVPSNTQTRIVFHAKALKFAWNQKFSINGAWVTGGGGTVAVAQQALPGIGCLNPDKNGDEPGGWYTMLMQSPLSNDIRPEFAATTPISQRMPNISLEPGTGVNAPSTRDIKLAIYTQDTLSAGANQYLEKTNYTIDRIEVRAYPQLPD